MTDLFIPAPGVAGPRIMAELAGRLEFDEDEVARGLALEREAVREIFRDGRRAQPVIERRLVQAFGGNGWRAVSTVGGGRRLVTREGCEDRFYDVRVMVEALSFAPSWMKGKGRRFDPLAFEFHYKESVAGVFVCDVKHWPLCPYWRVASKAVLEWGRDGLLGARGTVTREELPRMLMGFRS